MKRGLIVNYNHENGNVYPAMVTRVWSPTCINLVVFTDDFENAAVVKTSVAEGTEVNQFGYQEA